MVINAALGLQLCDNTTSQEYGSVRCNAGYGQCKGAARGLGEADNCYPHDIWASTRAGGALYHWAILNNGSFEPNSGISETLAFSVR